jgi:NAD(P)-dependent dehydrogenase (short-subunit alcohol dehydrogenase family)
MILKNRVAVITGANRGLGETVARAFAKAGANLILAARDGELLRRVAESIPCGPDQKLKWLKADISKPTDVEAIRDSSIQAFGRIDILVNNAGVYGPIGNFEEGDWQQWCDAININLLGTVAMSRAIVPQMKRQQYGKIINLSGGGATSPLPRFSAYGASKAAVVRFTETIAVELAASHIDVNAIAPGSLNTRLLDQVLEAGPERVGEDFYKRSIKQREEGGASLELAAELAVFLASAESDGISGRLISAIWDEWRKFPLYRERIKKSDVFTLRRIIPEDRGMEFKD